MYRYVFNHYSCRWEIQLLCWGFIWRTVRALSFENLDFAKIYTKASGIADYYIEQKPFDHRVPPIHDEQEKSQ